MLSAAWSRVRSFRLLHWGPIIALGLISFISYTTASSVIWKGLGRVPGPIETAWFYLSVSMLTFCYLKAVFTGPGTAPRKWKPFNPLHRSSLQFCTRCDGFKPPRAHHCKVCKRCCYKMDHHCPWINNCVGHDNHKFFWLFLTYTVVACAHAAVLLSPFTIRGAWVVLPSPNRFRAAVVLQVYKMFMAWVLALGLVLSIGCLWWQQTVAIMSNMTQIEEWIVEKADGRERAAPFVYPYDLGWRRNWAMVMGSSAWAWFLPLQGPRRDDVRSDGTRYPIRQGCGKYDLTKEQLAQKRKKQDRSFTVAVTASFNMTLFDSMVCVPVHWARFGWGAIWNAPDVTEDRLGIESGDHVRVTRVRPHWYFGRKLAPRATDGKDSVDAKSVGDSGASKGKWLARGWFPAACTDVPHGANPAAPGRPTATSASGVSAAGREKED